MVLPANGGPAKEPIPAKKFDTPKPSASLSTPTISDSKTDVREIVTPEKNTAFFIAYNIGTKLFLQNSAYGRVGLTLSFRLLHNTFDCNITVNTHVHRY